MKTTVLKLALAAFAAMSTVPASAEWKPVGDRIKTEWAEKVNPASVHQEYPRPIMERKEWKNLNGLWNYAIRPVGEGEPKAFDGEILVPFPAESSLSGVGREPGKDNNLWYQTEFTVPGSWKGNDVMLNFGGVDWKTEVFVNDIKVGEHKGGFAPFSFDITPYLTKGGKQKLVVKVWDATTDGIGAVGKQNIPADGIWYTPVTGIWQTVWLEPVSRRHITSVTPVADIDHNKLTVNVKNANTAHGDYVEVKLKDGDKVVASGKAAAGFSVELSVPDAKLWDTENPFLYGMEVKLYSNGRPVDSVKSYAAMRKISARRDANGILRMQLNNKDLFQFGPLDQGYWPDGLFTAPSDEAMAYDVIKTKDMGYNMIRKHMKVEPARWYTLCDSLGILVWQDMPRRAGESPRWINHDYSTTETLIPSAEAESNFRHEWEEIMDFCMPYPSVVVWTPFNECWGQFKTAEISDWTKAHDPSRLVNSASGGNHYLGAGDILDVHNYPAPELKMFDNARVTVLGEYGGLGMPVKGHLWQADRNWGYVQFNNAKDLTDKYVELAEMLIPFAKSGYSAAVYTQTTDVEGEVNGLMTYDRKKIKFDEKRMREINRKVCNALSK